ncbi:oligopeptide ABC transporter permease protein (plasmid) [Halorhabdus tiamatea SARL4B]|uniref:Oligopeptide ABC transporter permease protein n=1 Tax=Halorhabdus tiamatea SARL4B TaxID=1033806 RepID=S6D4D1_9EURY|nr:oligopeptide ABC transporter permease protein [Halorhabdus tiamatea SARL4B]
MRVIWSDWRTRIGTLIILFYVFVATVLTQVVPESKGGGPGSPRYAGILEVPGYPLGTNANGESLLPKLVHATPPMLQMIIAGAVFSTVIATALGTVSGYKGGLVDTVITTIMDIAMTIPGLPLIILVVVIFEPESPYLIGVFLAINAWAGLARQIRSQVLELRDKSYIEASRIMNRPLRAIITDDILPNIMPFVLISFVNTARGVIFGSVALFYLGVLPVSFPNWGIMLNNAYSTGGALYSWDSLYWILLPMITIVMLSFGLVLFSQGTERLFNPRIRARHASSIDETAPMEQ